MNKLSIILYILILAVVDLNAQTVSFEEQIIGHFSADIYQSIKSNLKPFADSTELAIAVIENGETRFYGCRKIDKTLESVENKEHIFEIGSITKVFTSTLLANAVLENKVAIDENIARYLDYPLHKDIELSFIQLANHSSGLPRLSSKLMASAVFSNNPYKDFGDSEMQDYLQNTLKIVFDAGEKSEYSNMGAGILGYALEKVYEDELDDLLQDRIFQKFSMDNSTILKENIKGPRVKSRNANGQETPYWEWDALAGAGAIYSSVEQLSKFAAAQWDVNNEELQLTQKETFKINDKIALGLGWHIITAKNGRKILWHNGGTSGSTSYMAVDLENKNAVIILSNVSAFHHSFGNIDNLGFILLKELAN